MDSSRAPADQPMDVPVCGTIPDVSNDLVTERSSVSTCHFASRSCRSRRILPSSRAVAVLRLPPSDAGFEACCSRRFKMSSISTNYISALLTVGNRTCARKPCYPHETDAQLVLRIVWRSRSTVALGKEKVATKSCLLESS